MHSRPNSPNLPRELANNASQLATTTSINTNFRALVVFSLHVKFLPIAVLVGSYCAPEPSLSHSNTFNSVCRIRSL